MSFNTEDLIELSKDLVNPTVEDRKKYKILKSIFNEQFTIEQLQKSRIGKSVKKCTKMDGKISEISHKIIQKWETMIEEYCEKNNNKISKTKSSKEVKSEKKHSKPEQSIHSNGFDNNTNIDNHNRFNSHEKSSNEAKVEKSEKKHLKTEQKHHNNTSDNRFNMDSQNRIHSTPKAEKCTSSLKEDKEEAEKKSFQSLINDNAMSMKAEELTRKRLSSFLYDTSSVNKRQKEQIDTSFIPDNLPELPVLDAANDSNTNNRSDLYNITSSTLPMNKASNEDIDVTSKYSSERRRWEPKSMQTANGSPEECESIKGVPITDIASYNAKQLKEFEDNNRKVMKATRPFWQKLFMRNYKTASRFEEEEWREAYFRVEKEEEERLRRLSERLNKKTEISKKNESRAKILIIEPPKAKRFSATGRR